MYSQKDLGDDRILHTLSQLFWFLSHKDKHEQHGNSSLLNVNVGQSFKAITGQENKRQVWVSAHRSVSQSTSRFPSSPNWNEVLTPLYGFSTHDRMSNSLVKFRNIWSNLMRSHSHHMLDSHCCKQRREPYARWTIRSVRQRIKIN